MPNANPAGTNQPLDQHPLPYRGRHVLGIDGIILPNLERAIDFLIVAPPLANGVREIASSTAGAGVVVNNNSGANITAVGLVYKDGNGNEATLASVATVVDGASAQLAPPASFFLMPSDLGLFVRFTAGADVTDNTVTAYAQWADVRGVERQVSTLVQNTAVALLPTSIPYGQALQLAQSDDEDILASCFLLNYDTVAHGASIAFTISDGTNTVPLLESLGAVATLIGDTVFGFNDPSGHHGRGRNIFANDSVAATTTAPVIMTAFIRTNHGPVGIDQGGAF
ncbi:MAG: hypothetical protein ACE10O_00945 [Candidatus Acidiferrales bacterium]